MLRRLGLGLALGCAALWAVAAHGGERPLAEAIRAAAKAARPAVVDVSVKGRRGAAWRGGNRFFQAVPDPNQPGGRREFRFKFQWPPGVDGPQMPELPNMPGVQVFGGQPTRGAGIILSVEGAKARIAAPEQTVGRAKEATVRLADGRELEAKVLGTDKATGLACLEVAADKLEAPKPAKPDGVDVGDWLVALGGPRSGGAVTVGVVSAKDRPGTGRFVGTRLIQTDAFVADDMVGGPVVNLQGEIVGMTLPPANRGRAGRQLTPVLPIHTLNDALDELARGGKVARGWLGITMIPVPEEVRRKRNLDHGVQVQRAMAGHPAANAGIRGGDIILEFGGQKVAGVEAFRTMVAAKTPGDRVAVKLLRGADEQIIEATLGEQPEQPELAVEQWLGPGLPQPPRLDVLPREPALPLVPEIGGEKLDIGVTLQALTPELAAAFGYGKDKGLVATAVAADSPAAKARPTPIAPGDLIREINREPVATLAQAKAAIAKARKAKAKTILVAVRNNKGARYLVVDLPK